MVQDDHRRAGQAAAAQARLLMKRPLQFGRLELSTGHLCSAETWRARTIATGGFRVLNEEVIALKGISEQMIAAVAAREQNELKRREVAYRGHAASPHISGKTIILVDDGIATGSTTRAAIAALGQQCPSKLVAAVPTAPPLSCDALRQTSNPNIPIIKRWSRPTVAPTNQMDPEIPLSQAEEEKSPARVRKTLNAAFDPSEKLIRSCSLF